jgi:hypothetical protein
LKVKFLGCVAMALVFASPRVFAHHGFGVEFDKEAPLILNGLVTKVEFMNPHVYFYMDVKDQDGKVVNWAVEGGPPNVLYRHGWKKDTVKVGDMITVKGFRARDGSPLAASSVVTLADGRIISGLSGAPETQAANGNGSGNGGDKQ